MNRRIHQAIHDILNGDYLDERPSQYALATGMGLAQSNISGWLGRPLKDTYTGHPTDASAERYLDSIGYPKQSMEEQAIDEGTAERRSFRVRGDEATCEVFTSNLIKTEQDALEASEVDLEAWEPYQMEFGAWGSPMKLKRDGEDVPVTVQLYRVAIKFRRKVYEPLLKELAANLIEDMRGIIPVFRAPAKREGHLLSVATPDIHDGKVPWEGDYDAPKIHDEAIYAMLERSASFPIEQVVFAIGNDALNTDGSRKSTTAGTHQDGLGRWQESFRRVTQMYASGINQLSQVAPVRVVVVPGNHDEDAAFYLGEVLAAMYSGNKHVTFDTSLDHRKYFSWKQILLGFTHGKDSKIADLPMLMAVESPESWSGAVTREWFTGHTHGKQIVENKGVVVRVTPSLAPSDEWHKRKGYVGNARAAEAVVFSDRHRVAEFIYTA